MLVLVATSEHHIKRCTSQWLTLPSLPLSPYSLSYINITDDASRSGSHQFLLLLLVITSTTGLILDQPQKVPLLEHALPYHTEMDVIAPGLLWVAKLGPGRPRALILVHSLFNRRNCIVMLVQYFDLRQAKLEPFW